MGGKLSCHLNSKEQRYISEHIADIMETLAPLCRVVAHGEFVLEGTFPQYMDGIWTHCHLLVTNTFRVESRDSKHVLEGGWGCKTELVLSGCHICTSIQDHCELVDDMCQHIKGKSGGKLVCWDCPTTFPVFMQHPYSAPVCLATGSHQEQTRWANILCAATQHQSSALWCEDSPESRTFLDAVFSLKKLRGNCQTEVLVSMVMEEVMSYLKQQVFPRIIAHHSRRRTAWLRLLSEVYRTAKHQASLLQDHIAHTITEDMCEPMSHSLQHTIIPRLDCTLPEVATPVYDGFASTWQYFLETCDDIIDLGSKSTSVLTPLSSHGPDDARMWQCLDKLELSSEGQTWLQETWGVHSGTWRPLLLKAQNALYELTAVLCRIKEKVVKHLDTELLALRSQIILEVVLQITLPAFTHGVGEQDLSCYYAMVHSEQALFHSP
ncbi:hypothetical protein EPR50_G00014640 [Perca flavescens]|uniref:Niban 1/2/3 domain-containing protein n=1 Tax=Perca flavescens TaxID=8167 RepID=A0A484DL98_PERFV|nr:hypothetical protein EPR50_G00014640 [Perca flavescens]